MQHTEEQVSLEEVFSAYYDCRRHKRNSRGAISFEVDYENRLVELHRQLNDRTYDIGQSRAFVVTRPKCREVFAADFRDRIVHHLLCNRLMPYIEAELIDDTYSCRKGRGTRKATERFEEMIREVTGGYKERAWCLCCDISNFFMSIPKREVLERVLRIVDAHWAGADRDFMVWLSEKVIMHTPQQCCVKCSPTSAWRMLPTEKSLFTAEDGRGLPIGNLPSQIFSNLLMSDFDHAVQEAVGDGHYIRYADDFRLLSRDKRLLLGLMPRMRSMLHGIGLELHGRKWSLQEVHKGAPFVGVMVKPGRTYVRGRLLFDMYHAISASRRAEDAYTTACSYYGHMKGRATYKHRLRALKALQDKFPNRITGGKHIERIYLTK